MIGKAAAAVAVGVVLGIAPAAGAAGTYEVVSCDAAGGVNHAWSAQAGSTMLFVSRQRCPALGVYDGFGMRSTTSALTAPQLASSWWRFDAPRGTSLQAIDWAGHYSTSGHGWAARVESSKSLLAGCGPSAKDCERVWAHGAKPVRFDLAGASWVRVGAVCLSAAGCKTGDGRTTPYVDASTWYSRLIVRDPDAPEVQVSGAAQANNWVQPGAALGVSATDASGISQMLVDVDGVQSDSRSFDCDRTIPRPCQDRSASFAMPEGLSDGRHAVTVSVIDAAGNVTRKSLDVGIDATAPVATAAPNVEGDPGWRSTPSFAISWQVPQEVGVAPVSQSHLQLCPVTTWPKSSTCLPEQLIKSDSGYARVSVELPLQGTWRATVWFEDAAGNVDRRNASDSVELRWDATAPGPGLIEAPGGWLTRAAAGVAQLVLSLDPSIDAPLSGVAGWAVSLTGEPGATAEISGSVGTISLAGLNEGITEVRARAIGGSGIASRSVALARVRIDATPPAVELSGSSNGGWATGPVTLSAQGRDQAGLSGMATGDSSHAAVRIAADDSGWSEAPGDQVALTLSADGIHSLRAQATDAAGNSSGIAEQTIRIDSTAPEKLAFLPQDTADPRVVRVDATDRTSGIGDVRVRLRPVAGGDWVSLDGAFSNGRFVGVIDESKLSSGLWELEATAHDVAGNERVATRTITDDPAVVALPLRKGTRIEAAFAPTASGASAGAGTMRVDHGRGADVGGRLLDAMDQPISGASVALSTMPVQPGATWSASGVALTDHHGRFSFHLPPGPSRRLSLKFSGDHADMPSSFGMTAIVAASSSISASPARVKAGQVAIFKGALAGGWIPAGGKLVMVQAMIPGRGWQTFSVARTDTSGVWNVRYRFRTSIGSSGYLIRVVVPAEAAYPFDRFTSSPLRIRGVE